MRNFLGLIVLYMRPPAPRSTLLHFYHRENIYFLLDTVSPWQTEILHIVLDYLDWSVNPLTSLPQPATARARLFPTTRHTRTNHEQTVNLNKRGTVGEHAHYHEMFQYVSLNENKHWTNHQRISNITCKPLESLNLFCDPTRARQGAITTTKRKGDYLCLSCG